ncbi:Adenylate cyclase type 3, partial [Lonchura striata]
MLSILPKHVADELLKEMKKDPSQKELQQFNTMYMYRHENVSRGAEAAPALSRPLPFPGIGRLTGIPGIPQHPVRRHRGLHAALVLLQRPGARQAPQRALRPLRQAGRQTSPAADQDPG